MVNKLPGYASRIHETNISRACESSRGNGGITWKGGKNISNSLCQGDGNYIFFDFEFHDLDKYSVMRLSHLGYNIIQAKELVRNYLVEARWLKEGYMPTLEEYMSVSMVTGTYGLMIARSYVGRGDIVTEDTFKWVSSYPPIIKASCVIVRLMDDIVSHKVLYIDYWIISLIKTLNYNDVVNWYIFYNWTFQEEQERGHVASSIECYSKESGASEEEACEYISRKVEDAWKVINRESLRPTAVPFPLIMPAINLARMCEVLYSVNDGFTHAEGDMKSYMKSFFVHPMVV